MAEVDQSRVIAVAEALRSGGLAILPTDTVYGICADIRRDDAVRALYAAKGKGSEAPLQILFAPGAAAIETYAVLTPPAERLLHELGPGGWTVITTAADGWDSPALAGGRTVGIRIPNAPVLHAVLDRLGGPVAASSANRHGGPSPVTCPEALAQLGEIGAAWIDGGPCEHAIDSTVIDCSGDSPRILREGAIDRQTVARILGLSAIPVLRSVRP